MFTGMVGIAVPAREGGLVSSATHHFHGLRLATRRHVDFGRVISAACCS